MGNEDKDPREGYLSAININESKIISHPQIIFLFGGEIRNGTNSINSSIRAHLYNHIVAKYQNISQRLVIPEDFSDWLYDGIYQDLLTFEQDLAQFPSMVCLIPESPGSLAELGAFSANKDLREKVVLIMSQKHHEQNSFIMYGPVRLLQPDNICAFPYDLENIQSTIEDSLDDICEIILERADAFPKQISFNSKLNGHVAVIIYELISVFGALKISEIEKYLDGFSISEKRKTIKRLIFLLEKMDFVRTVHRGNSDFYLPRKVENRMLFANKDGVRFDRNKVILGTQEFYKNNRGEKLRFGLIKELGIWG